MENLWLLRGHHLHVIIRGIVKRRSPDITRFVSVGRTMSKRYGTFSRSFASHTSCGRRQDFHIATKCRPPGSGRQVYFCGNSGPARTHNLPLNCSNSADMAPVMYSLSGGSRIAMQGLTSMHIRCTMHQWNQREYIASGETRAVHGGQLTDGTEGRPTLFPLIPPLMIAWELHSRRWDCCI